jgi:L-ascorbate metabolism protein UlaG (beta-lactamase superfamily)
MRWIAALAALIASALPDAPAHAQSQPVASQCLAIAQTLPKAMPVSYRRFAAREGAVTITYAGHSTYMIETPGGVTIATDFSGVYTAGMLPTVATMNRAHSTHYTLNPDPRIAHILHGWGEGDAPAQHAVTVGDAYIRNVPTDIRAFRFGSDIETMQKNGNSIFIFEVAGLCIGHLGHLHHRLDDSHIAAIGRLDVVMVPIDNSMTMSLDGMSDITTRLRSSVVLPMHRFGTPLQDFLSRMRGQYEIDLRPSRSFTVSLETLPRTPTMIVLEGV